MVMANFKSTPFWKSELTSTSPPRCSSPRQAGARKMPTSALLFTLYGRRFEVYVGGQSSSAVVVWTNKRGARRCLTPCQAGRSPNRSKRTLERVSE